MIARPLIDDGNMLVLEKWGVRGCGVGSSTTSRGKTKPSQELARILISVLQWWPYLAVGVRGSDENNTSCLSDCSSTDCTHRFIVAPEVTWHISKAAPEVKKAAPEVKIASPEVTSKSIYT